MLRTVIGSLLVCVLALSLGLAGCTSEESQNTAASSKADEGNKATTKPSDDTTTTQPALTASTKPMPR